MNFNVLLLTLIMYSFSVGFKKNIVLYDSIPLIFLFLLSFNKLDLRKLTVSVFRLNGVILLIVLTVFIFHRDYYLGCLIFWRVNLILLFNLMIIFSHSRNEIFSGIVHLKLPWKLKAIFLFSFKYLDIFLTEKEKLFETLKARNFKSKTNIFTYRTIAFIVGSLFYKGLMKAEILKETLTVRCFNGRFYTLSRPNLGVKELGLMIIVFILFLNGILEFAL